MTYSLRNHALALAIALVTLNVDVSGQDLLQVGQKLPTTEFMRYAPKEERGQVASLYRTKPQPTILFVFASW